MIRQSSHGLLRSVGSLKRSLPSLRQQLAEQLLLAHRENAAFQTAYEACFGGVVAHLQEEHARPGPFQMVERREEQKLDLTRAELDTLLVQWCLLEPLLHCVFSDVLEQNRLASLLASVLQTLPNHAWLQMQMEGFFGPIEQEWRACTHPLHKQSVLSLVCEQFLNGFDPPLAERLSVISTPQEVIAYLCRSTAELIKSTFGRSISQPGVLLLDPCAGIGQFTVFLMPLLDAEALPYTYDHELFGVEIMLLPYCLALLNIEQTFFDLTGQYRPFPGMRYADALA